MHLRNFGLSREKFLEILMTRACLGTVTRAAAQQVLPSDAGARHRLGLRSGTMDVLQLDVSGRPQAWIAPREAAVLYASDAIAWTLGETFQVLRGGIQRASGLQSRIELHPIVAVRGAIPSRAWRQAPALSNHKLFNRDRHVCAYCGGLSEPQKAPPS